MKNNANMIVENSFAGIAVSNGDIKALRTQVAKINISERVCVGDKLTASIFLN